MTIICDETIIGLWYVQFSARDVMAGLNHAGPGQIKMTYRVRHYRPDPNNDPFNDHDEKTWGGGTGPDTEAEAIRKIRLFIRLISVGSTSKYELLRGKNETPEQFTERLAKMPFAHAKLMNDQEYKQRYGDT